MFYNSYAQEFNKCIHIVIIHSGSHHKAQLLEKTETFHLYYQSIFLTSLGYNAKGVNMTPVQNPKTVFRSLYRLQENVLRKREKLEMDKEEQ